MAPLTASRKEIERPSLGQAARKGCRSRPTARARSSPSTIWRGGRRRRRRSPKRSDGMAWARW